MILGYAINGPDNDSYLNPSLYGKNICECLDYIRNRENYITKDFKIKKTKYDISYTYDGAVIVSTKFKNFCEMEGFKDLEFYILKRQTDFYLFKATHTIEFDSTRRKTQFLEYNSQCNEYNEVVGANPVCLKKNSLLKPGFYRTDIEFARGYAKHPLMIVDIDTYQKFRTLKLNGFYGEKILDIYDWEKDL